MKEYGLLGLVGAAAALILVYGCLDRRMRRLECETTAETVVTGFADRA